MSWDLDPVLRAVIEMNVSTHTFLASCGVVALSHFLGACEAFSEL